MAVASVKLPVLTNGFEEGSEVLRQSELGASV